MNRQFFAGKDFDTVLGALLHGLHSQEISMAQTQSTMWLGQGMVASWGVTPRVSLSIVPSPSGFYVDIRISAQPEGSAVALLVVSWMFCFPLTILFGYLAYQDFTERRNQLLHTLWSSVSHLAIAPNYFPPQLGNAPPGVFQGPPTG
jgi:hypothetical protein